MILESQYCVGLLKEVHCLYNQQDGGLTGLTEIVTLKRSLALNVEEQHSELECMRMFKATAKAINLAEGYTGGSIIAAKLVAK